MKKLMILVPTLMFAVGFAGMAVAGSVDSPGSPSGGSGMYSLAQIYDYLNSGIVPPSPDLFQEPGAAPGSTMKTTKQIFDEIKAKHDQCLATVADVNSGVTFFCTQPGSWGVQTGTLVVPPTATASPTPAPTITPTMTGGEWVLVPGNTNTGDPNYAYQVHSDFYVMKYEAKQVSSKAYSQAADTPWLISISSAAAACTAIGAHLCTVKEAQTINRNLEQVASNWYGGIVGTNGMYRGNCGLADSFGYNKGNVDYGTGRDTKARLTLSNTQEIWDWSGNVGEWIWGDATDGTIDTTGGIAWDTGGWYEWNTTSPSLSEERSVLGPSTNSYTSTQGMGQYYGGLSTNTFRRGGRWMDEVATGCFGLELDTSPASTNGGVRCCR
ncbi:MAG: hypothetical protein NTZ78_02670 [Candidatus Aureabacteria bacterium]|nr:hypothetical protein [Candidatus Auribacterota bacterium]